jgi:hypothetical protein
LKVFSKDRTQSPTKENSKAQDRQSRAATKDTTVKSKSKSKINTPSRPNSSTFDSSRPHWILKWVTDQFNNSIDLKKDTDRAEEIKNMKKAWESVEVGRAARATIARTNFLKTNLIKADGNTSTDDENEKDKSLEEEEVQLPPQTITRKVSLSKKNLPAASSNTSLTKNTESSTNVATNLTATKTTSSTSLTTPKGGTKQSETTSTTKTKGTKKDKEKEKEKEKTALQQQTANDQLLNESANEKVDEILLARPPTPPKPKIFLPPIDISPFLKTSNQGYIIKDSDFENEQAMLRKQEMENFLKFKEIIQKSREEERRHRFNQKIIQIEECEALQVKFKFEIN